jgi:uncharacterized integral membrane protein
MLSKLLQNKYDQALIMVGVGVVITLLQMLGLYIFFKEAYIESRAIINTMNIIAPLLCFGFDSSSPQITKEEKSQSFIWNFIFIQIIFF